MKTKVFLKRMIAYAKNYGRPKEGERISVPGIFAGSLIVLLLTWLPVHFGCPWLCILLIGEYKESFEYWRHALKAGA